MDVHAAVLAASPDAAPIESRTEWWARHRAVTAGAESTLEQAILGGFAADRLAYAFASAYEAALRALVPDLPPERVASLCITERGGAHPRDLEARLEPDGRGGFLLSGRKRWATLSGDAGVLLVAASTGRGPAGENLIRVVRVESDAPGVTLHPMDEPPFTPEIGHDEVELERVAVAASEILPGDGLDRYLRPFRTLEDLHVQAAVYAYLIREARLAELPRGLGERMAALLAALRALAEPDPSDPAVHLALAGVIELGKAPMAELEKLWARTESPSHARWERDRLLLSVSAQARAKRVERAWRSVGDQSTGPR